MFEAPFIASYLVLWVIVVLQTFVLLELLRQIGIIRRLLPAEPGALLTADGLERGDYAPPFHLRDLKDGISVSLSSLRGRRSLLLFVSPRCETCRKLAEQLPAFARDYRDDVRFVTICAGRGDECLQFMDNHQLPAPFLFDSDEQTLKAYRVSGTPNAVLINEEGRVLIQGVPNEWQHLAGLIHEEGTPIGPRNWHEVTLSKGGVGHG
jgi:methylamine dehydrogenase accessory protein MauD